MSNNLGLPLDHLSDLLIFVRVADARSFTVAAERLGISRSAVGKGLQRLEEALSLRLMHRTTRSANLTEDGRVFYEYANQILLDVVEAGNAVGLGSEEPRGRLRIDMPIAFGRLHVLPLLTLYLQSWPDLDADISLSDDYSDLVKEGIDIAIRIGGNQDSGLIRKSLAPHRLITCASPKYMESHIIPKAVSDLARLDLLVFSSQGLPHCWLYDVNGRTLEYNARGAITLNNTEAIVDAAIAGFGVCQVGAFLAGKHIAEGRLIPLLEPFSRLDKPICAVYPSRKFIPSKVRHFVSLIEREWQGKAAWDIASSGQSVTDKSRRSCIK